MENDSRWAIFSSIKRKAQWIYYELKKKGYEPTVYFTGHKSYHLSICNPKLKQYEPYQRVELKRHILEEYGGDLMKSGKRCMIAMESEPHYRSGKRKAEVLF